MSQLLPLFSALILPSVEFGLRCASAGPEDRQGGTPEQLAEVNFDVSLPE
jgi:hypothetical protein